ncbi:MAG: autotransporter-associated beta strand repeat-containing protein, partial [Fuerstiella sp.]|nr:autotransporter-associated beta strand repeat-containing protein [Fuerstiella sp.]
MATRDRSNSAKHCLKKFRRFCKCITLALPVVGMLMQPVAAQTWNGAVDNVWNTGGNWVGGVAPGVGATAIFDDDLGSPGGAQTITLTSGVTLGILDFNVGSQYTIATNGTNLTFNNGGISELNIKDGGLEITGLVQIMDDLEVFVEPATPLNSEISAQIYGLGSLTKTGNGTLTLSGTNLYEGGTTIDDGILSISNDANLGNVAGGLTFNGGTLQTTAGITSARTVTLNAGTIDTNGFDSELSGIITGVGGVTKIGLGTLTLSGTNDYTDGTTVNDGTLSISSDANLGNAAGGLTLDGATLLTTAGITSARTVTLNAGTIDTNGFDS